MENQQKEVYYDQYCYKCKFKNTEETEDPCNDCMNQPYNFDSHKPVNFKEEE